MAQRRAAGGARKAPRSVKHRLPERLPTGLELQDVGRRRWRLGRSIGTGGFGEIYLACELPKSAGSSASNEPATVPDDAPYVVKVEPHSNGPLFTEMHCYHRLASGTLVADWMKQRRLTRLGMPAFLGSGSVEVNTQRYRFMVLERYGTDLQRLIDNSADSRFPAVTVMRLAVQVLDVLEYIHSKEYVHADVKAQNLLVGFKKGFQNQVYLLDFGLACRYTSSDGEHNSYRADKRKAHNGTLEFTSRDAHVGAHSRRGDLEVLGYNLLLWAGGQLPWLPLPGSTPAAAAGAAAGAGQCELVAAAKNRHMSAPRQLVARCCAEQQQQQQQQSGSAAGSLHPAAIAALEQYLEYVGQLQFEETPQYDVLRAIFTDALRVMGHANYAKLAQKPLQFDNHSDCVDAGAKKAKTGGKIAKTGRATTTAAAKKSQKQQPPPQAAEQQNRVNDEEQSAPNSSPVRHVCHDAGAASVCDESDADKTAGAGKKRARKPKVTNSRSKKSRLATLADTGVVSRAKSPVSAGGSRALNNATFSIDDDDDDGATNTPPLVKKRRSGLRPRR